MLNGYDPPPKTRNRLTEAGELATHTLLLELTHTILLELLKPRRDERH